MVRNFVVNNRTADLNVTGLEKGIYILRIAKENGVLNQKIIIQ
jgi:hypothetical protein